MKKLSTYCALFALLLGSFMFASCEKSNKDLLKDYQKVSEEIVTAIKDGDLIKAKQLSEKGEKIDKELGERELTDSEKEKKAEIEASVVGSISEISLFQ